MNPTVIEFPEFRCRIVAIEDRPGREPEFLVKVTRPLRMQRRKKLVGGFKAAEQLALIMGRECARRAQKPEPEKQPEQLSFA